MTNDDPTAMKIKFRKVTNIRSDHHSLSAAPLGVVYANTMLEVDGIIHEGASVKGDNRWWRDHNGWYYWAGETESVAEDVTTQTPAQTTPSTVLVVTVPPPAVPTPPVAIPAPPPIIVIVPPMEEIPAPDPTRPPVAATEFVGLPVPDDNFVGDVPEGEWRSLDEHIIPLQEAVEVMPGSSEMESFQVPPTATVNDHNIAPPELLTPRAQRLNWGLETGQIPGKWWQEKRLTGREVTLAILCTGADARHPDLTGTPPAVFANLTDEQTPEDSHGLGTQAAIVAAGRGRIAYGVAPEVKLLIGKIGSTPNDISPESLIAGLEWAIAQKADVAAMLVDFIELSVVQKKQLTEVIARALDANMVLLAPVGNSSDRKPENRFPASLEGVISVGSHQSFNRRSDFSAKSYHLDFLAPGEDLNTSDLNQGFGKNLKNTAIATAFAAGFVTLLKQWEKEHNEVYSPTDIAAFLCETAHYEGINKGKDTEMGCGILNPQAVLERLMK